jgi:hypothetical protein
MKDGFAENFILSALRKKIMKKISNTKKYNVYFNRYVQTAVKETISMKEFGLAKGM